MEKLLERVNKLTTPVKSGIILGIIVLVTAGTYFLFISDIQDRLVAIDAEQKQKDQEVAQKQALADNLSERQRELDKLEEEFKEALTHLPEKKDIEELLVSLSEDGKKSGLEISRVTPGTEAVQASIASIPITMSVSGNYHEIALFLQEVANRPRIVHVSDLKLTQPTMKGDKVSLNAEFVATTYRFADSAGATKPPGAP